MPAPDAPLTGDELLAAVTEAMVALHQRYHHREPMSAKTLQLGDDLLASVLAGVYTDVEKTMIELQQTAIVHHTRSAFQMPPTTQCGRAEGRRRRGRSAPEGAAARRGYRWLLLAQGVRLVAASPITSAPPASCSLAGGRRPRRLCKPT
jgi:Na+-translocating membrane potential-generating system (MpsC)